MKNIKGRSKISLKAKVIFTFIPIICLVLMELFARLFVETNKMPGIIQLEEMPKIVALNSENSKGSERLEENYNKLTTGPVSSLPFMQTDNKVAYFPKFEPNLIYELMTPAGEKVRYAFNSHGFRGNEIELVKQDGKKRIICAGDSSTLGYMVNIEDSYPAILEKLLSENGKSNNFEIINAGVLGYTSYQGLKYYEMHLRKLHPDILVFSYGYNDSYRRKEMNILKNPENSVISDLRKKMQFFATYTLLERWISKLKGKDEEEPENQGMVSLDDYRKNLEEFVSMCKKERTLLLFMPISVPAPYSKIMREIAEREQLGYVDTEKALTQLFDKIINDGIRDYKGISLGEGERRPFKHEYLQRFGSEEMMRIRECNYLFMDYCHPSKAANMVIAEELFKYLSKQEFYYK
ncbi:hypothetical protein KKB18_07985 [bacterium]|nr:hypothetical protein [bacterium]